MGTVMIYSKTTTGTSFLIAAACWCYLSSVRFLRGGTMIYVSGNTLRMLQDEHMLNDALLHERNLKCNESLLCANDTEKSIVQSICGSDGRTYSSACELKKAYCHGNLVHEYSQGPCPEKMKCMLSRSHQQMMQRMNNDTSHFIPECEPDGSYSPIQCYNSTGYCWCMTSTGAPIPSTSVRNRRPKCTPQGKVGRRSSRRRLTKRPKGCTTIDRAAFNNNLVRYFVLEYEQEMQAQNKFLSGMPSTRKIIEWKFENLDKDRDNRISRREIKPLRTTAVQLITPKVCAKRFSRYCDSDNNRKINRPEWFICLGIDMNVALKFLKSLNTANSRSSPMSMLNDRAVAPARINDNRTQSNGEDLIALSQSIVAQSQSKNTHQQQQQPSSASVLLLNSGDTKRRMAAVHGTNKQDSHEEDRFNCAVQRQRALDRLTRTTAADQSVYVPECSRDNASTYERVQCHVSTGFCWCVEPATGRPVPGTSVQHSVPNCTNVSRGALGEIKDCKPKKKKQFYDRLLKTMESSMIASGDIGYDQGERSRDQNIVMWQFKHLDKNMNTYIDKKEWGDYRKLLKAWAGVRKCGRNFLRFCDRNEDKKIDTQEWLDCTLKSSQALQKRPVQRSGSNPFLTILKSVNDGS